MIDRCGICGSDKNDGWSLETVIDHSTGLVTSRELPCEACLNRTTLHSHSAKLRQRRGGKPRETVQTRRTRARFAAFWVRRKPKTGTRG
ncbi:hypothetical protein FNH05_12465 [Amycolatopsis rhizosphaerae]|uniref:Uncharacterized protein n=1 Tax=Amycolatopsis rhizosphaerae TaxID=2053003 RepID=A0A558CVL4_9PSEU|nr:hypothetical protein [Amycolatopsis rhizosphaerae]TVT52809.1 hypothetical protein FNH05_12465 [Amycolatopsis rhizosphaerae]